MTAKVGIRSDGSDYKSGDGESATVRRKVCLSKAKQSRKSLSNVCTSCNEPTDDDTGLGRAGKRRAKRLLQLHQQVHSPPYAQLPRLGDTFVLNPMFTFFAVQTQLHFFTVANYEIYLPPNVGCQSDGGLCSSWLAGGIEANLESELPLHDWMTTGGRNGSRVDWSSDLPRDIRRGIEGTWKSLSYGKSVRVDCRKYCLFTIYLKMDKFRAHLSYERHVATKLPCSSLTHFKANLLIMQRLHGHCYNIRDLALDATLVSHQNSTISILQRTFVSRSVPFSAWSRKATEKDQRVHGCQMAIAGF